jgi:hypothetical protein
VLKIDLCADFSGWAIVPRDPFVHLSSLSVGDRFRTESGRAGMLLSVNELRARVQWDARSVSFGHTQETEASHAADIAPRTEVQQIA